MGEVGGEHVGLWKCTLSRRGVRGMSFPLEDVFILVCLCARRRPRVAGTHLHPHRPWMTLWKSSGVVCACLRQKFSVIMQIVDSHSAGIRHQESERYRVGGIVVGGQMCCNADQKNSIFSTCLL